MTAADRVPQICDDLEQSDDVVERAEGYARRATREHPINRAPSVVAAASVYLACLLENEKRTQADVAAAADVSPSSIRDVYRVIAAHEDVSVTSPQAEMNADQNNGLSGLLYRLTDEYVIGDRCPCDRCGSGVKMRAFAVVVAPALVATLVTSLVAPDVTLLVTLTVLVGWWLTLRPMFDCINDQMPATCPNTGEVISA